MNRYEPCMCGATDCRTCGPLQGYRVVKVWDAKLRRMVYRNPEEDEIEDPPAWSKANGVEEF